MSVAPPLKKRHLEGADDRGAERERVRLDLRRVLTGRVGERIGADPRQRDGRGRSHGGYEQRHGGERRGARQTAAQA